MTRRRLNPRPRAWLALATVVFAALGFVVATLEHRSIEDAYATTLVQGSARTARVETLLVTKQRKTIVGVLVDGRRRTVDVATDSHDLVVESDVIVHVSADERAPIAIDGTEPWSWWGTMVQVFAALGVAAFLASIFFLATGASGRTRS